MFLCGAYARGAGAQDPVETETSPRLTNDVGMDRVLHTLESAGRDSIINWVGLDEMANFGFQSLLHHSRAGRKVHHLVGWVAGLLSAGEELA